EDVAAYVQTMQAAYAHIHNTDSNAILIMGPMAYDFFYDPTNTSPGFNSGGLFLYSFIDNVLTELGKSNTPAFDAIAINAYIPFGRNWESDAVKKGRTGVDVAAKVNEVRARVAAKGYDFPIVVGEGGFWSFDPGGNGRVWVSDGKGNY